MVLKSRILQFCLILVHFISFTYGESSSEPTSAGSSHLEHSVDYAFNCTATSVKDAPPPAILKYSALFNAEAGFWDYGMTGNISVWYENDGGSRIAVYNTTTGWVSVCSSTAGFTFGSYGLEPGGPPCLLGCDDGFCQPGVQCNCVNSCGHVDLICGLPMARSCGVCEETGGVEGKAWQLPFGFNYVLCVVNGLPRYIMDPVSGSNLLRFTDFSLTVDPDAFTVPNGCQVSCHI